MANRKLTIPSQVKVVLPRHINNIIAEEAKDLDLTFTKHLMKTLDKLSTNAKKRLRNESTTI